MKKSCSKCKELKSLNLFGKDKVRKDGLSYFCKSCVSATSKAKDFAPQMEGSKCCSDCNQEFHITEFHRKKTSKKDGRGPICKRCKKKQGLRILCNITEEQIEAHLQATACDICSKELTLKNKAADHCHDTNRFRGTVCTSCNFSLGHAFNNVEILTNMIKYLKYE